MYALSPSPLLTLSTFQADESTGSIKKRPAAIVEIPVKLRKTTSSSIQNESSLNAQEFMQQLSEPSEVTLLLSALSKLWANSKNESPRLLG